MISRKCRIELTVIEGTQKQMVRYPKVYTTDCVSLGERVARGLCPWGERVAKMTVSLGRRVARGLCP